MAIIVTLQKTEIEIHNKMFLVLHNLIILTFRHGTNITDELFRARKRSPCILMQFIFCIKIFLANIFIFIPMAAVRSSICHTYYMTPLSAIEHWIHIQFPLTATPRRRVRRFHTHFNLNTFVISFGFEFFCIYEAAIAYNSSPLYDKCNSLAWMSFFIAYYYYQCVTKAYYF